MEGFFSRDYMMLWAMLLALALFYPVRQLIWVLYMRRARTKSMPDEAESRRLKRRATATSVLMCIVFSVLYTNYLFTKSP